MNCQGNHGTGSRYCEIWKKEKEITRLKLTQNINYLEARRIGETTKYAEVTKKISQQSCHVCKTSATTKPEVVAQLVNKMRAKTQTPELLQAKRDRQSQTGRAQGATLLR